jgi:hypothetical protein
VRREYAGREPRFGVFSFLAVGNDTEAAATN